MKVCDLSDMNANVSVHIQKVVALRRENCFTGNNSRKSESRVGTLDMSVGGGPENNVCHVNRSE